MRALPVALLLDDPGGLGPGGLELLAGRLHPLLVHFPIAFLLTAAAAEVLGILRGRDLRSPLGSACLNLGLLAALAAAASGWALAANEDPGGGERLELHRWSGLGTALLAALAWVLGLACRRARERVLLRLYRIHLIAAALLVGLTAHVGASLVWGSDWLLEPLRAPRASAPSAEPTSGEPAVSRAPSAMGEPAPVEARTIDFATRIRPLFEGHCIECHGDRRAKGRLRLDAREHVLGPLARRTVVVPGEPAQSELLRRVALPAGDPDAMPPEGERLPREAIEDLRAWIAEGAPWPVAATEAAPSSAPVGAPATAVARPSEWPRPAPLAPRDAPPDPLEALRAAGARAVPLAVGSEFLDVSLARVEPARLPGALDSLLRLGPRLRWLDLSGADVGDAELEGWDTFVHLERLRIDRTRVTDGGVGRLARLPELRVLNLVGTPVGDAGLAHLASSPRLERVYVWGSAVSEAGVRALTEARPGLEVVGAAGPRRVGPAVRGGPQQPSASDAVGEARTTTSDLAAAATALLADRCVECHGPERSRGRLRLDERERALAGRRPAIVAGDPTASELLRRVALAPDDPDVMPPDPPHLEAGERDLLSRWIAAGAPWPARGGVEAGPGEPGAAAWPEPDEGVLLALRERGALAQRIALDERGVEVSLRVLGPAAGDGDLRLLRGLEPNLVWLDLSGTAIGDAGLAELAGFERLERVVLARTAVEGPGLSALADLPRLATLNLFGTRVGDGSVPILASFGALERVFVAQSALTAEGVRALRDLRPELEVLGSP